MAGPRLIDGAPVLLFERLTGTGGTAEAGTRHGRFYDAAALRESVRREVERLFNTQAPLHADVLQGRWRSTIDYGVPHFTLFWPGNVESEARLASLLTQAVEAYEPRLRSPRVTVHAIPEQRSTLIAAVEGELIIDRTVEPIAFTVAIRDSVTESHGQ